MDYKKRLSELSKYIKGNDTVADLKYLINAFPEQVVFSTSLGQEDQAITEIIAKNKLAVKLFTLDTGRLFNESYDLLERTISRYKVDIEVLFPNQADVEELVKKQGINGFYHGIAQRKACCFTRKVVPLKRGLKGNAVWITGLRAEQSESRQSLQVIEWDEANQIIKYNPLLHWTYEQLRAYISENSIPYNKLHDEGFISIGCAPCTRAISPGEPARAGRWWWESSQKECGLHAS
ncbi:phosphoadenylyl-sulfate reductase [Penaeicola halotolerans]|uniref:phosphoadenylyl-sulfate reductase n=1 Tax=Penaeicola halotolerans TaxID=2793196 RepID=UPI001CF8121D|nr:phosphoadenylyl-sulfate reductase [Penaeicola halotolerans]